MKKVIRYGFISSYKNLAMYFKKMASKGYMISDVSRSEHFFDKVNPKDLDFQVTIFNEYDLLIYGDREKHIKKMKKNGWKYVLKNDKMIVFCKPSGKDVLCHSDNDKQQYEMVKSIWNRDRSNRMRILAGALLLFLTNIYDFEFPLIYISNNFMKIITLLAAFLVLSPIICKTPYWIWKNKENISEGKELYHYKRNTDKFFDFYMYIGIPAMIILKWLLIMRSSPGEDKFKVMAMVALLVPVIAFVIFYRSKFFGSIKSKYTKYAVFLTALAICFISAVFLAFFFIMVDHQYSMGI